MGDGRTVCLGAIKSGVTVTTNREGKVKLMARRDFNPIDVFFQLESDLRRSVGQAARAIHFRPDVDMYETATALVVKMELPGVEPERLEITLSADDRILKVAGDRREPAEDHQDRIRCFHLEIYFGTFEREVTLPTEIHFDRDNITANYRNGFLVISLPKRTSSRSEVRSIEISQG